MMVKYKDINSMSTEDLNGAIEKKQKEMIELRFQLVSNQLKNTAGFRKIRKEIAQMMTAINSKKKG